MVKGTDIVNKTEMCSLSTEEGVTLAVINLALSVLGTTGNFLVCLSILLTPSLQVISNWFLFSMAVGDLLNVMIAAPMNCALNLANVYSVCLTDTKKVFRFVANISGSSSLTHLCFISLERCVAILKPFTYNEILDRRQLFCMFTLAWVLPLIYTILRVFVTKTFTSYLSVSFYCGSYVTILVSYSFILHQVHKQRRQIQEQFSTKRRMDLEKGLAVTIAVVILVISIAWVPLFYYRLRAPNTNYGFGYECARTLVLASSVFNPVIYNLRSKDFRKATKKLISYCCEKVNLRSSRTTRTTGRITIQEIRK